MNLAPKGIVRRVLEALLLLVGISVGARIVVAFLQPVIPMAIGGIVLVGLLKLFFGRRWR